MPTTKRTVTLALFGLALLVTACATAPTSPTPLAGPDTAAPTATAPAPDPVTPTAQTTSAATYTPSEAPAEAAATEASATEASPTGLVIGLLTPATDIDSSTSAALTIAAVTAFAADNPGVTLLTEIGGDPRAALDEMVAGGASLIIYASQDYASNARAAAQQYQDVQFIGVDHRDDTVLGNLLILGGARNREDELGFMAGMMAGFATENKIVGSVAPAGTVAGLKYANGFVHGMRVSCGECTLWPIELEDYDDPLAGADAFARLQRSDVDTVFAVDGPAGQAALQSAAAAGLYVVTTGQDLTITLSAASELAAPSPVVRPDQVLPGLLQAFAAGTPLGDQAIPFSLAANSISYAPNNYTSAVTEGELGYARTIMDSLASGILSTGIDVYTGRPIEE